MSSFELKPHESMFRLSPVQKHSKKLDSNLFRFVLVVTICSQRQMGFDQLNRGQWVWDHYLQEVQGKWDVGDYFI